MNNLTISIVNYNAGEYLVGCLRSLEKVQSETNFEVVIVDNASTDQSAKVAQEKFPKVIFLYNKQNVGFGRAHNQTLKKSKTEYLLILNPDVEVGAEVLRRSLEYMEKNYNVGALSPKIVFQNGKTDLAAHRGFPTPWASLLYFLGNDSFYHLTGKNTETVHEVDAITGAFFLTRKRVLEEVGYFDEDYFMYGEDIDLCFRIKKAGYKVIYFPATEVIHYKGISSGIKEHSRTKTLASLETKKRSLAAFYEAMKIFYKKHMEAKYPFFINWLVYLAIDLKWWMTSGPFQYKK